MVHRWTFKKSPISNNHRHVTVWNVKLYVIVWLYNLEHSRKIYFPFNCCWIIQYCQWTNLFQCIFFNSKYTARRLIGSRMIESAAYCNQKLLAHLYLNSKQNTSVNWIIRLMLSLLCWPKVIVISGGHCMYFGFRMKNRLSGLKSFLFFWTSGLGPFYGVCFLFVLLVVAHECKKSCSQS